MRRKRLVFLVAFGLFVLTASPALASPFEFPRYQPQGLGSAPPAPVVTAPAWILYDATLETTLAASGHRELRAPASITKVMTVLLALENGNQTDMVNISARAAATGEREIGVWAGERVTLGSLLRSAMVHSANDAATAIAEHIGGSVEHFAEMMNQRARELGMNRTNFVNPHGLDATGHVTSAEDMLLLGLAAMERQDFREIAAAKIVIFPDAPDGTRRRGTGTNLMLESYEGTNGVKTGFTNRALLTFIASAERDGRELFAVVLGSQGQRAHFADARALFDHGFVRLESYGLLAGLPASPSMPVVNPSPTLTASGLESLMHVAGEGLLQVEVIDDPIDIPPPPVPVTERIAETPDEGFWGAVGFWFRSLLGQ
jgi:D-alanyl-D-alanine carboxypeptidase